MGLGPREPIAIIGIGCRFPQADNPSRFWDLLCQADEAIGEVPPERWRADSLHEPDQPAAGKIKSWRGGFVDHVDAFDWRAFRMLPREVRHMDPQHRLLLEVGWEALEDAGLSLEAVHGSRTSVVTGLQWNDFLRLSSQDWSQLNAYTVVGNPFAFAANRLSYIFGLHGPSLAIDCGCSSGLAAMQVACHHLWMEEADLALVGGVELILSPDSSIMMSTAGLLSPEGQCRTLDANADGFVRSEGAGILVLKPVSKLSLSDRPYAILRGLAVGHNGHNEWILASNAEMQKQVIHDACERAGVSPADIDYVELHGTATPRGDPIEAKALADIVGHVTQRQQPCLVGSVKPNIGHLGAASGMASLIKVALSLYHRKIPPMRGPEQVHPGIPLPALGLALPEHLMDWPDRTENPTAGITTLSLGGVNAHAILSAPPALPRSGTPAPPPWLLPLSARSEGALLDMLRAYSACLPAADDDGGLAIADICYTASMGRSHHRDRLAVVGRSGRELAEAMAAILAAVERGESLALPAPEQDRIRHFFPGPPGDVPAIAPQSGALARMVEDLAPNPGQPPDQLLLLAGLGRLYQLGFAIDWPALYPAGGRVTALPTYPWQRERLWPAWLDVNRISTPPEAAYRSRGRTVQQALTPPRRTAPQPSPYSRRISLACPHASSWSGYKTTSVPKSQPC